MLYKGTSLHSVLKLQSRKYTSIIFDRELKAKQKRWAYSQKDCFLAAGGLRNQIDDRLRERIKDLINIPKKVLILGNYGNTLAPSLRQELECETVLVSDIFSGQSIDIVQDEESAVFPHNEFEAIIGNMNLHWINNLEDFCRKVRTSLTNNGVFLGSIFGGETLFELRSSLVLAQQHIEGGLSPRLSPMISLKDLASLLTTTGFHDITVDCDEITIYYPRLKELVQDLQLLGESNALVHRKPYIRRDLMDCAAARYQEMYGDSQGHLPATFQILSYIGWKDPSKNR